MIIIQETPRRMETANAGTREWLQASKNMVIATYGDTLATEPFVPDEEIDEPIFGTHLREAAGAIRRLLD